MINKEILSWLITVPSGDINFKNKLKESNIETIKQAIKITEKKLEMTKLKKLKAELNRKEKNIKKERLDEVEDNLDKVMLETRELDQRVTKLEEVKNG